jgi:hypothetical protein
MKILFLAFFALSSLSFAKTIDFEIWDRGDGSSYEIRKQVDNLVKDLVTKGEITKIHNFTSKFPAICGAKRSCYDINPESDFEDIFKQFQTIYGNVRVVESAMDNENWYSQK